MIRASPARSTTSASTAWKSRSSAARPPIMFGEKHDPEFLKHLFETTEILRKPVAGIIAGYHVLRYILVGLQEAYTAASVEIRGEIKVSPRFFLAPGRAGHTF